MKPRAAGRRAVRAKTTRPYAQVPSRSESAAVEAQPKRGGHAFRKRRSFRER